MILEKIIATEIALELKKIKTNGIDLEVEGIADFEDCKKVIAELNYIRELNEKNPRRFNREELLLSYKDVYEQFENAEKEDKKNKIQTTPLLKLYRALVKTKISSELIRLREDKKGLWLKKYYEESTTMTKIAKKQNLPTIKKLALFHEMNSSYLFMKYNLEKKPSKYSSKNAKNLYEQTKDSLNTLINYFSNQIQVDKDFQMRSKHYKEYLTINLLEIIKNIKLDFQSY